MCGRNTKGPGKRNPGRNLVNANVSCSKKLTVPSTDCTHKKSLPFTPPNAPRTMLKAERRNWCSYASTKRLWSPEILTHTWIKIWIEVSLYYHGSRIGYETVISANYTEYRELKILCHMWRTLEIHFKISISYRYFLFYCKLQLPWTRSWKFKKESCKYDGCK